MIKKLLPMIITGALLSHATFAQAVIPVPKQIVISGTVTDDPFPSKRVPFPIKDVKVRLWQQLAILNSPSANASIPVPGQVLLDSATTSSTGAFAFKPVSSPGAYQVSFDNPLYVSREISVSVISDTSFTVLLLAAGAHARVAGTVWAACTGYLGMPCILQPIPGCTVMVSKTSIVPIGVVPLNTSIAYPIIAVAYTAVTDSLGRYAIDSIPLEVNGEAISVSARAAGYTAQTVDTTIRNNMPTTVNFSLAKAAAGPRDTVYVTPHHPTTSDSLYFILYNAYRCCGTIYRGNSVSVSDTTIYLSYTYDDTLCPYVNCFAAGSETNFSSKPIPAGRYAIYKVESLYCPPGRACPLFLLMPERVGTVTVSPAASVLPTRGGRALVRGNCLTVAGTSVWATIARSAKVTLRAYDVRGALMGEAFNGWMPTGTHHVNIGAVFTKATAQGTVLLVLTVDGVATANKTIIISR